MTAYDHPEYIALIAAIRANPDCDGIRLAVADWLEEQGEGDRAAFIRCQVEVEQQRSVSGHAIPKRHCSCLWCRKSRDSSSLFAFNARTWADAAFFRSIGLISNGWNIVDEIETGKSVARWKRGFVENVRIRGADWITHAEEILKRNPVRKVTLVGNWGPYLDTLPYKTVWPSIEFTFEWEGPDMHFGLASADQADAMTPGLYFGNDRITVDG